MAKNPLLSMMSRISDVFTKKPKPYEYAGSPGTYAVQGYLQSDEKNPALRDLQTRVRTYDQIILNDHIVALSYRYYNALIGGITWTVKPNARFAEDPTAIKYADMIQHMLELMSVSFAEIIKVAASHKWYGSSVQEWKAARMDEVGPGFIGISEVEERPLRTLEQWITDDEGKIIGWVQRDTVTGQTSEIPRSKCIYVVDKSIIASPDGVGLLRHLVQNSEAVVKLEQLEGHGHETDIRGIPVGKAPLKLLQDLVKNNQITATEQTQILSGMKSFIENHFRTPNMGIILDSGSFKSMDGNPTGNPQWGLETLQGGGQGMTELNVTIERKNRERARLMGTEGFMMGADGKGSLALSEDKTANLAQIINSTVMEVVQAAQKDFLGPIFAMNGWDRKYMCSMLPDAVQLRTAQEIVTTLSTLASAGAPLSPADPVVNQIRRMLHLLETPSVTNELASRLGDDQAAFMPSIKAEKPVKSGEAPVSAAEETHNEIKESV